VKGAAAFEKETLIAVTEARARVGQVGMPTSAPTTPEKMADFQGAQDQLGGALSRLLLVAEAYPQLTATEGFRDLQAQLEGTENRIAVERMRFNEVAREYNKARSRFPASIVAGMIGGFEARPYFTADPGAQRAPEVEF
jgi:LemA protein